MNGHKLEVAVIHAASELDRIWRDEGTNTLKFNDAMIELSKALKKLNAMRRGENEFPNTRTSHSTL